MKQFFKYKKLLLFLLLVTIFSTVIFINKNKSTSLTNLSKKVKEYNEVKEGEEKIDGTDSVTFDSFFLRDTNGDSKAESYRGSQIELGKTDKLYFELKVLGEVTLKDAVISFKNSNVRVSGTVAKSTVIPKTMSSTDFKSIPLAEVGNGTTSFFYLDVVPFLENDLKAFSGDNKVILTGTVVDNKTKKETKITKEINYEVDSYASKISASIASTNATNDFNKANIKYEITVQESGNSAPIKASYLTGSVSDFKGVHPSKVLVTSADGKTIKFNYDEKTQTFTAEKDSTLSEDKVITSQAYNTKNGNIRYNKWIVYVEYPIEDDSAYSNANISINAWYTGYANDSLDEIKSNVLSKIITHEVLILPEDDKGFKDGTQIKIGDYVESIKGYFVDKTPLEEVYLGTSNSNLTLKERWSVYSILDSEKSGYIKYTEIGNKLGNDKYLTDYLTYKSVRLSSIGMKYKSDGPIKILNAETGEVLVVINKDNYDKELELPDNVHKIEVETGNLEAGQKIVFDIDFVKEIDSKHLVKDIGLLEFAKYGIISNNLNASQICKDNSKITAPTEYGSASFTEAYSNVLISLNKTSYDMDLTKTSIPMRITISHNTIDLANKEWLEGYYLVKLPKEIIGVEKYKIDTAYNVIGSEVIDIEGQKYIKILTSNESIVNNYNINIDIDAIVNPKGTTTTQNIELYAINKGATLYRNEANDIYDLDDDGNDTEKVGYASSKFSLVMPAELLTGTIIKEYDDKGSETISPLIADVDPTDNDSDAKVEIFLLNNSQNKIQGITLVGKIAYQGNTYQIGDGELGSEFDVEMAGPIEVPKKYGDKIKVYYSEEETPDKDDEDAWEEEPDNYNKVKSYLIKIDKSVVMNIGDEINFTYPIEMPDTTDNLHKVTYFTHGVYFDYITDSGSHPSKVSGAKLGVRMARKYDLYIDTYKIHSDTKIKSGVYILTDEDNNTKTISIDSDGNAIAKGLYVGKKYTLTQHSLPNTYVIDNEKRTFVVTNEEDDSLKLTNSNNYRSIDFANNSRLNVVLENEVLYTLDLHNIDVTTKGSIKNTKFKVTGPNHNEGTNIYTDADGHAYLKDMVIGEVYEIEQVKIDSYAATYPFKIKLVRDTKSPYNVMIAIEQKNEAGEMEFKPVPDKSDVPTSDNNYVKQTLENYLVTDSLNPVLIVEVPNKYIEKFTLEINKVDGENGKSLKGAQFKITGPGLPESGRYITTDTDGKASIDLYLSYTGDLSSVAGLDDENYPKTNTYKVEEVAAPPGYSIDNKPVSFRGNAYIKDKDTFEYSIIYETNSANKFISSNIDSENKRFEVVMKDFPLITITKEDEETGEVLPNTYYVINEVNYTFGKIILTPAKDANGNYVGEKLIIDGKECYVIKTNSEGKITLNLSSGKYQLREIQAADDKYDISDEVIYFGVGETVPYKAAGMDFIGGYTIDSYITKGSEYPLVYRTSDDGYIIINKTNMVKYDSNYKEQWNYTIPVPRIKSHTYTKYFDDPDRIENETYNVFQGTPIPSRLFFKETEDAYFLVTDAIGLNKINKETGESIFTGEDVFEAEYVYEYTNRCEKVAGKKYYDDELIADDDQHVYCDKKSYELNNFRASYANDKITYDINADSGIRMYINISPNYGVRLANGDIVMSKGGGSDFILNIDLEGNIVSVIPMLDKLKEAQKQYVEKYNVKGSYYDPTVSVQNSKIKALSDGSTVFVTNSFIAKFDKNGDVVYFTPLGYNGKSISFNYYGSYQQFPVYIDDEGSVYIEYEVYSSIGDNDYYGTEKLTFEIPKDSGNTFGGYSIIKYGVNGDLENITEMAKTYRDLKYPDSNAFKRVFISSFYFAYFIRVDDGYIIAAKYVNSYNGSEYTSVELASGEVIHIPSDTNLLVYKVNDDSSVEWVKSFSRLSGNGNGFFPVEIHGEDEFSIVYTSPGLSIAEEGNDDIPPIERGEHPCPVVILNFKLTDEVVPESPEGFDFKFINKRKKYNINVSSNEGGTFEIKDSDDNVTYKGEEPGLVETVKHGDDTENTIKIIPNEGYTVKTVTVNGEPANITVNEDGTVIVDKFINVTEEKNIVVTFELGSSNVIVHHYLKNTKTKISNDELLTGKIDTEYTTAPKTNKLYSLTKDNNGEYVLPENYKGNYTTKPIEVIYYYDVNQVKLVVNYKLKDTDEKLAPSLEKMYILGSNYSTNPIDIEYYKVVDVLGDTKGTLNDEVTEVTYYYDKLEMSHLKVRYVDKDTKEDLVEPIEKDIEIDSEYETEPLKKAPKGYKYVSRTANSSGKATYQNIEVIYYYEKVNGVIDIPETLDSIVKYLVMFIISIFGLLIALKRKKGLND